MKHFYIRKSINDRWHGTEKKLISLLTAVIVFCSSVFFVIPVAGMEASDAAGQNYVLQSSQQMQEPLTAEPVTVQPEPAVSDPAPTEPAPADPAAIAAEPAGTAAVDGSVQGEVFDMPEEPVPAASGSETDQAASGMPEYAAGDTENAGTGNEDAWTGDNTEDPEAGGETAEGTDNGDSESGKDSEDSRESEDGEDDADDKDKDEQSFVSAASPLVYIGDGCTIKISFTEEAMIPEGAYLLAQPVFEDSADYEEYRSRALNAVEAVIGYGTADAGAEGNAAALLGLFDLTIFNAEGYAIEPQAPVTITASIDGTAENRIDSTYAVHFVDSSTLDGVAMPAENVPASQAQIEVIAAANTGEEMLFEAGSLSVYALVITTTIEETVLASDGNNYRISVTYDENAAIPDGAELYVREIVQENGAAEDAADGASEYEEYLAMTRDTMGWIGGVIPYARFFDISIMAGGQKVQPAAGSTVNVSICLMDKDPAEEPVVIHFADGTPEGEIVGGVEVAAPGETGTAEAADGTAGADFAAEGTELSFGAEGFSVYAIVDAPEPDDPDTWNTVSSLEDLRVLAQQKQGIYMSHENGYYFTDLITQINSTRTGITKTGQIMALENVMTSDAVRYYFEKEDGTDSQFYVYCLDSRDGVTRKYVKQTTNSLSFTEAAAADPPVIPADATAFTASCSNGIFMMLGTDGYYWTMQGGAGGKSFAAYKGVDANSRFLLRYPERAADDDPYRLDGKSYGIAYHNDTAAAAALMPERKDEKHLAAKDMLMRPDVLDHDGVLLVAEDSDIAMWTFHNVTENRYYISVETAEGTKYLNIDSSAGGNQVPLTLTDQAEASLFTLIPGSGANSKKYSIRANGYSVALDLSGQNTGKGFWATKTAAWLNLAVKSDLDEDAFNYYTAKKVSVSKKHTKTDENGDPVIDENGDPVEEYDMPNGAQVVMYTRIWNDTDKKYEFYVVDHDGSLIRGYDTGDGIEWIGSTVNTALWDFTEYYEPGTTTPNYYYELQNVQFDNYIAPQLTGGQIFSNKTIGINMNGRRFGENQTTIIAWDKYNYSYSGLKAENGKIVSCPLSEADDFYFAIVEPKETEDKLTTVNTIDSTQYGITMKMVDFNNPILNESGAPATNSKNGRDSGQTAVLGYNTNAYGLVSTDLKEDGYPVTMPAVTGKDEASLAQLFGGATPVNHLFIQSIYNESGYFEYDSTQNFAHLNEDGTFTVYDQIGAVSSYMGITGQHGQFLPYNVLTEGKFCEKSDNNTSVLAEELSDLNARKGEKLYDLGHQDDIDYFFGMELEAGFTQTANGLDAWGHDIVFEFSGDDDFWLYVDGELVLDVGGVHAASVGTVNFRTGEVRTVLRTTTGATQRSQDTTLRALFEQNYRSRNPEATDAEVAEYLGRFFEEGSTVFKDYSQHTMKMLYMERGAGASNLHMRFNLAAVQPGHFILSKELSGTDSASNSLIEFPYQIWYTSKDDAKEHLLGEKDGDAGRVMYDGTNNTVTYKPEYLAAGVETPYEHVFLLKPGQSADVALPEDAVDYRVVECGINPAVYNEVSVNGKLLTGDPEHETAAGEEGRKDYNSGTDTLDNRQKVDFDNHVNPDAIRTLSITKKLYDEYGRETTYAQDDTPFNFRLCMGNESADPNSLPAAYLYTYYIKDLTGRYCRWDAASQKFVPLAYTEFADLKAYLDAETTTALERDAIAFKTSSNGAISGIPGDHVIEVRDLIVGTRWKIEERDNEIPKGYTRRNSDGYVRTDLDGKEYIYIDTETGYRRVELDPENPQEAKPISDIILVDEDPAVQVRNQRGWGLTVEKVWTDSDFMTLHDPIYFAVYLDYDPAQEGPELYPGTVRQLQSGKTELYYFFDDLYGPSGETTHTYRFADYTVREVTISTPDKDVILDENGVVTNPGTVTPIAPNGTLTIGGTPVGGEYQEKGFEYTVTYQVGDTTGAKDNANIRTDIVTNSRPGIRICKTKWDYTTPLADSVFTLKDADGSGVAAASYTSDGNGLVTIAYLNPGTEEEPAVYTLKETGAPEGYAGLESDVTISVSAGEQGESTFEISGPEGYYTFVPASSETDPETGETVETMAVLTIRNRTASFRAVKTDASTGDPLEGAHFALYRQVEDIHGHKQRAHTPEPGFENIVTDENGVLPDVDYAHLIKGLTYYLHETQAPEDYDSLEEDVCFTYGQDGRITIESVGLQSWVTAEEDLTAGTVTYTLTIPNGKMKNVSFLKVDIDDTESPLEGARFDLYAVKGGVRDKDPLYTDMTSGADGLLVCNEVTVFALPAGTYHLVETQAPDGYLMKKDPVVIEITDQDDKASVEFGGETAIRGAAYDEGTELSTDAETGKSKGIKYDAGTKVYTLKISDKAGTALPVTGGPGTKLMILFGSVLTVFAALLLWRKHRFYDC